MIDVERGIDGISVLIMLIVLAVPSDMVIKIIKKIII